MDHATVDSVWSEKLLLPSDRSLLTMQDSHVTKLIWSGKFRDYIRPNDHSLSFSGWKISEAQTKLLKKSGFYKMSLTGYVHLDSHLITAVLDRWRPETNTLHFPFGEMTVTLEDVAFILGLPVSGKVVCGRCPENPRQFVKKMLGESPKLGSGDLAGNRLRLTWLRRTFQGKKNINTEAQIVKATRAYILYLLGSTLFSDSGTGYVHIMYLTLLDNLEEASSYAWGAAGLAYLYRAMTKAVTVSDGSAPINLCGSFTLLMCWIYEHLPTGRPKFQEHNQFLFPLARKWNQAQVFSEVGRQPYLTLRPLLDQLRCEEVTFRPYRNFPKPCKLARRASRYGCVDIVLTAFHVIAAYNPRRCMPQFGMVQGVPPPPTPLKVSYTSRPSPKMNYPKRYSKHIRAWDAYVKDPKSYVLSGENVEVVGNTTVSYKEWYERVSICRVHPYTIEAAKLARENKRLREAAAEYSLLTEPYVKEFLRDKHNRMAKLFKIIAPYQHLVVRKARVLDDSSVSCWSGEIDGCIQTEEHVCGGVPVESREPGRDCVQSAEGEGCVRREEVTHACKNCDSGELCVDHSVALYDYSAAGMSFARMDSIRIDDEHPIDKCCSTEQAEEGVNGESLSYQDRIGFQLFEDTTENSGIGTTGGLLLANEDGKHSEASLPDLNIHASNDEARSEDNFQRTLCQFSESQMLPESSDFGGEEAGDVMDVELPVLIPKIMASAESGCLNTRRPGSAKESGCLNTPTPASGNESGCLNTPTPATGNESGCLNTPTPGSGNECGCLNTPTPAFANDGDLSPKTIEGPKNKCRVNIMQSVYKRRAIKPLKSGLVVRHDTRSGIPGFGSDDAPDSHREICALVVPNNKFAIEYQRRKKRRAPDNCKEDEAKQP